MNHDAVRASFGRNAAHYAGDAAAAFFGEEARLARMCGLAGAQPGMRALDVATGGGFTAFALAAAGCRVAALDLTVPMLQQARAGARPGNLAVAVVAGDSERLPVRDGAFDLVACRLAPHHFPDPARFVREAARALAPGGAFYLFDLSSPEDDAVARWLDDTERLRDPSHVCCWRASTWERLCAAAGLRVRHLERLRWRFDMRHWLGRADVTPDVRARLVERIRAVPAAWREALSVDAAADPPAFGTPLVELVAERG